MISRVTVVAGHTIFTTITMDGYKKRAPGEKRAKKEKPTTAEVMRLNRRYAEKKLAILLNHNFRPGDYHVVLTYSGPEPTPEEARADLEKLKRKAAAVYRDAGLPLKWVSATEYKNKRIHHHLVMSGGLALGRIQEIWGKGIVRAVPLKRNGDYRRLAAYLIKETDKTFREPEAACRRRYSCSRTIVRPVPRREKISAAVLLEAPKARKGYYIDPDSVYRGSNPITDKPYLEYVEVSLTETPRVKSWNRGKKCHLTDGGTGKWLREHAESQLQIPLLSGHEEV